MSLVVGFTLRYGACCAYLVPPATFDFMSVPPSLIALCACFYSLHLRVPQSPLSSFLPACLLVCCSPFFHLSRSLRRPACPPSACLLYVHSSRSCFIICLLFFPCFAPPFIVPICSTPLSLILPVCLPDYLTSHRQTPLSLFCSQRLERLLGVSGPNSKKKRAKLEREIAVEDGMGDDFGAFLSDLDRIADVSTMEGSGVQIAIVFSSAMGHFGPSREDVTHPGRRFVVVR